MVQVNGSRSPGSSFGGMYSLHAEFIRQDCVRVRVNDIILSSVCSQYALSVVSCERVPRAMNPLAVLYSTGNRGT